MLYNSLVVKLSKPAYVAVLAFKPFGLSPTALGASGY
jgi:hypothetical protein